VLTPHGRDWQHLEQQRALLMQAAAEAVMTATRPQHERQLAAAAADAASVMNAGGPVSAVLRQAQEEQEAGEVAVSAGPYCRVDSAAQPGGALDTHTSGEWGSDC
jgi:hypothetical protein